MGEILRRVKAVRNSVETNNYSCITQVKFKADVKDENYVKRLQF